MLAVLPEVNAAVVSSPPAVARPPVDWRAPAITIAALAGSWPVLAWTLELISREGSRAFYRGPIARAIVAASRAQGGIASMRDFADYTVQWAKPVACGYPVLSDPPPSSGGVTICEIP